ncbi:MAG: ATP-dependent zinc metalloprotease FtsH [Defluviitaleaceae bacterium]|nr:ATP-dependent zinc metalloprotease FtsH [Defluviitaleaceae bacterium]
MPNNNKPRRSFGVYLLVILFVMLVFVALNAGGNDDEGPVFTYSDLYRYLALDRIQSVHVLRHNEVGGAATVTLTLRPFFDGQVGGGTRTVSVPEISGFMNAVRDVMLDYNIEVTTANPQSNTIFNFLWPFLIILVPVLILFFFLNQMQGGGGGGGNRVMSFGKTRAKAVVDDKNKKTFENVAGLDEEKADLQEIVEFLKQPQKFTDIGARIPKGVLLVGPPGTGKTLLAKAVAGEAGVPFFSISGSDFVEMFVGVGASRVRDLFEQAKKSAPCIVFIDEIDAVGRKRGAGLGGGHDEREQTLNQLLVEMDGFGVNEGIIILAATNRPDILDPALLRPGRFDRRVVVGHPDIKGRKEILAVHAVGKKIGHDVDFEVLSGLTAGFTGADLENLLNESALLAARDGKLEITMAEIRLAFVKVAVGAEKKSRVVSAKDKKMTAYHEAGHAIAMEVLTEIDPVHLVSVIPTGMAGGFAMPSPSEDKTYHSKKYLEQRIIVALGGRAAEELIFQDITTGAGNDIKQATGLARNMVMRFGMSELGPILFDSEDEEIFLGRNMSTARNYSETVATDIDNAVKKFIDVAYEEAKQILTLHMSTMHKIAEALIEREKLTGKEVREMFDIPPPPKTSAIAEINAGILGDTLMDLTGGAE